MLRSSQIFIIILGISIQNTHAQLGFCSGNSGDPIFNETFGTGTNYGPTLPGGITTYNFVGNSGPQDGEYTIGSNTFSYGWNLPSDHTPDDTNGKALIVNASFTSGEFYKTSINGLCEYTTYEFSAWLINILPGSGCDGNGIPVNVKFEIWDVSDTNLLASGDTGDIFNETTPNWQQYGLVFQTLVGQTSVILKMLNNGVGGCGNDLAIDDIVFKSCGDSVALENNNGNNSFEACEDQMIMSVPLTSIPDFSVYSTHAYQWQVSTDNNNWSDVPGATNNSFNAPAPTPTGTLFYRVKFAESANNLQNPSCNSLSEPFIISILPLVTPTFNATPSICMGDTFSLPTTSTNGVSGSWEPTPNNTTTTTYTFTPNMGQCATTQNMTVVVDEPIEPSFNMIPPICSGDNISLPTTSLNNILGTWSPSLDNTTTTTYTFTPGAGQCQIPTTLTIIVNPLPIIDLEDFYAICINTNGTEIFQAAVIDTNLSVTDYSFVWTNSMNEVVGTDSSYTPMISGQYLLLVTDLSTGCQNEEIVNVQESRPPEMTLTFTSPSFSNNGAITVAAIGGGDYEFNLDNGPWQNSPNFSNVSAGNHTVLARDKYGCGFSSIDICLIGAPNFFTPNGDNINETWNVQGVSCLEYANIYIFDRFGKLLKEFNLNSPGWNGTFNGEYLQTNDYWYVIKYKETFNDAEKEHRGHFTLKR